MVDYSLRELASNREADCIANSIMQSFIKVLVILNSAQRLRSAKLLLRLSQDLVTRLEGEKHG